jgi:hypothetical protein
MTWRERHAIPAGFNEAMAGRSFPTLAEFCAKAGDGLKGFLDPFDQNVTA